MIFSARSVRDLRVAASIFFLVSRSMRSTCWRSAIILVFFVVSRSGSWITPRVSTPRSPNFFSNSSLSLPMPVTPRTETLAPSAARLLTTLPEPPRVYSSFLTATTWTGASGEMRSTSPQTYSSIIKSPTTSRRHWSNFEITSCILKSSVSIICLLIRTRF